MAATLIGAAGVGTVKLAGNAKSPGLVPANAKPVIINTPFPVFVTAMVDGALALPTFWSANESGLGANAIAGADPFPVKPTLCGLLFVLSVSASVAVRVPEAVGWKMTEIVVDPLTATVMGFAGVGGVKFAGNTKSPGFDPPKAIPLMRSAVVPVLVIVIVEGALAVPTP